MIEIRTVFLRSFSALVFNKRVSEMNIEKQLREATYRFKNGCMKKTKRRKFPSLRKDPQKP